VSWISAVGFFDRYTDIRREGISLNPNHCLCDYSKRLHVHVDPPLHVSDTQQDTRVTSDCTDGTHIGRLGKETAKALFLCGLRSESDKRLSMQSSGPSK
jgi:hypothetical protein